jgi:hypothetical protein
MPLAELNRLPIIENTSNAHDLMETLGHRGLRRGSCHQRRSRYRNAAPGRRQAQYAPIQSISYVFGSKSVSGYFVRESGACAVTLMISEKSDPDHLLPTTPTRVRLVLNPGQGAGFDSAEGRSLNIVCGPDAQALLVDAGERAPAPTVRQGTQARRL